MITAITFAACILAVPIIVLGVALFCVIKELRK